MAPPEYDHLPTDTVDLNDVSPPRLPRKSIDSGSDSDISYRDNLDQEPFTEKDHRFHDEPVIEDGEGFPVERRLRPRKKSRKILAVLVAIVGFAAIIGGLSAWGYSAPSYAPKSGNKHITIDHVFNGTFGVRTQQVNWVKEAADGTFSHTDRERNIILNTVRNMTDNKVLVDTSLVIDSRGHRLNFDSWSLSADMEYVLFKSDHLKQWRHSSHGNYWIHRLSDSNTFPIETPTYPPLIALAKWSPTGHALAYVKQNDLYILPASELSQSEPVSVRVTEDGSEVIFNGVPDWAYEEEVFETDSALWWSPDSQTVAYLRSNEAAVEDIKLQYFNPGRDAFEVHQYLTELDMKYPKPGTPNPLATVHTFYLSDYLSSGSVSDAKQTLSWPGEMEQEQRIIVEIGWVGDDALLVKEIDRTAREGQVVIFQGGVKEGTVVRELGRSGEEGDDGWIDHGQDVIPVKGPVEGYLDLIPREGFNHIAFFTPVNATTPIWITSGEWEVTSMSGVDTDKSIVYFMAAHPSIDRHMYSAPLPSSVLAADYTQNLVAMTDSSQPGYYEVSFSPGAKYYWLSYKGPEVPWQRVLEVDDMSVDILLEGNGQLNDTLSEFMRPMIQRTTIASDGYELNMLQIFPPNMDTSGRKKYPVLIRVYGGPGSQMVSNQFSRDWHTYLACEKKYIIVMLDGRGTGLKGRALRNPVQDRLGYYETMDQIAAAREMVKKGYVDRERIGIWGWSYGGYMTLKVIEAMSGIFTLGMAVAPVTNWLYYDSIYTERYMNLPKLNMDGYTNSSIQNFSAFGEVDFIWAHGSGDDNVHFMNTASFLDKLTQEHVRGWRFRMFTDSNHNMDKREAFREVYQWMTDFLEEKWGRGGTVHH